MIHQKATSDLIFQVYETAAILAIRTQASALSNQRTLPGDLLAELHLAQHAERHRVVGVVAILRNRGREALHVEVIHSLGMGRYCV